jgi:succinate-semialdehyde dehydrogenase/glutarate-semialdehyde dehydrogenase
MGDPLDEGSDIGPQAREDLRDELHRQVLASIEGGARCLLGGRVPDGPGAFYPPTVLTGVREGSPAYDEELFGPVAAIIPAKDEADALRIANDSVFGLGAAVFTRDTARGERIAADELDAGACFVNAFVRSDPRLPFGGVKESGYGRELSHYGIKEFVNIKTVYVK